MAGYPITASELVTCLGVGAEVCHRRWSSVGEIQEPCDNVFEVSGLLGELPEPWNNYGDRSLFVVWPLLRRLAIPIAGASRRWGPARLAVLVASSGLQQGGEGVSDALVELVRQQARARGPAYAITGGMAASGRTLRSAMELLKADFCDAVVLLAASGPLEPRREFWSIRGELGSAGSGPLLLGRDGLHPGEGAAAIVLERQGHAEVELRSVLAAADPSGALGGALAQAGIAPDDLTWACCGADGRLDTDRRLAEALKSQLGANAKVTSAIGRRGSLGAAQDLAALVEIAKSIEYGRIGPMKNAERMDPQLSVRPVTESMAIETELAVSMHAGIEDDFTAVVVAARNL